jgi:hypothetical protein
MASSTDRRGRSVWAALFLIGGIIDVLLNGAMPLLVSGLETLDYMTVAVFCAYGCVFIAGGLWILRSPLYPRSKTMALTVATAAWVPLGAMLLWMDGGIVGRHDPLYNFMTGGAPADAAYSSWMPASILLALLFAILGARRLRKGGPPSRIEKSRRGAPGHR